MRHTINIILNSIAGLILFLWVILIISMLSWLIPIMFIELFRRIYVTICEINWIILGQMSLFILILGTIILITMWAIHRIFPGIFKECQP